MKSEKPDISFLSVMFPSRTRGVTCRYVPVGVLSLAAYLIKAGLTVEFLDGQQDYNIERYTVGDFYNFFSKAKSKIIGISVMAKDLPLSVIAAGRLKEEHPDKIMIFGGPGPTGVAFELMERFNFIDFVICGEGEITLSELLDALKNKKDLSKINGLVFRDSEGRVIKTPHRQRIKNLDILPSPAYHLAKKEKYSYIYLPASRGCGHFCAFCDQPALWQGKEVRMPVTRLFDEIDAIMKFTGTRWGISFADNEFCADPERFDEFISILREKYFCFPFAMDRRIDAVTEDQLKRAKKVGCELVLYGVESGSDKILKEIGKDFTADKIEPGLLISAKHIQNSIASFMFNYPFETLKDFLLTINIIYRIMQIKTENFVTCQLHYLAPLPRTPIFAKYKDTLIRRNVSNLMTSKKNDESYHLFIDEKLKKMAVLPRKFKGEIKEEECVKKIIEENPEIFPAHYIYNSPDLGVKEKIIEALRCALEKNIKKILWMVGKKMVYVSDNFITAAASMQDESAPSVIYTVWPEQIEDPAPMIRQMKGFPGKKLLLSFALDGMPKDPSTGNAIIRMLEKLETAGIDFTIISRIPRPYIFAAQALKLEEKFGMPEKEEFSADKYFISEDGVLTLFDGTRCEHYSHYCSREEMHLELKKLSKN